MAVSEKYTQNIGVVFGQKSLLWWDIAPQFAFRLYKAIYEMSEGEYAQRLQYLVELFGIEEFMHIPTKKLSLGQRMRCELVAALIHKPTILFLDEPTIGLDVVAKQRMREAIRHINQKENTTIILTTHDMGDVEELAHRIIVLDKGKIIHNGNIDSLRKLILLENQITFEVEKIKDKKGFEKLCALHHATHSQNNYVITFNATLHSGKKIMDALYKYAEIKQFELKQPTLEHIIRDYYVRQSQKKH